MSSAFLLGGVWLRTFRSILEGFHSFQLVYSLYWVSRPHCQLNSRIDSNPNSISPPAYNSRFWPNRGITKSTEEAVSSKCTWLLHNHLHPGSPRTSAPPAFWRSVLKYINILQIFFAYRVHMITRTYATAFICTVLAILSFVGNVILSVTGFEAANVYVWQQHWRPVMIATFGASAAADVLIAANLCCGLWKRKNKTIRG